MFSWDSDFHIDDKVSVEAKRDAYDVKENFHYVETFRRKGEIQSIDLDNGVLLIRFEDGETKAVRAKYVRKEAP